MSLMSQISAATQLNLHTLPQRVGASSVIVIGIAGVVAVLVSVLSMSTGLMQTLNNTGRDDRAIVTRNGAASELSSNLGRVAVDTIADTVGVKRNSDGNAIVSAETFSLALLTRKDGTEVSVPMRGLGKQAFTLRPEMKLISGRMFNDAVNEVIVGQSAQKQYAGLEIGSELQMRNSSWRIVGVFTSNGDSHESELLANGDVMQAAMRRIGSFQSMTVMLESPQSFQKFKDALTSNPNLSVDVMPEKEYFAQQSQSVSNLLSIIAYVVGGIMGVGAIFGALNSMYSAVSTRMVEIATLRAIGFGATPIVISVLIEALLLALLGGVIGAAIAWIFFDGYMVNSSAGGIAGESRIFTLYVSPALVVTGITSACLIGLFGGLFPAIRAARLPVATALRATT